MRVTGTAVTCVGSGCGQGEENGRPARRAAPGSRLCAACRDALVTLLKRLPALHEECGRRLNESGPRRERTSGGPLPGMPFNTAAAEARSDILKLLRSWAGVLVDERGLPTPGDTVPLLSALLVRHADWLAAHATAADVSAEFARLVRRTRRVVDPEPLRRVVVGTCVEVNCPGGLTALIRSHQSQRQTEIVCDVDSSHRWSSQEWLLLGTLLARRPGATGLGTAAEARAARWLSAGDIAQMWNIATGSVYRHASEQQWRRRSRSGRTTYHEADVRATLSRWTPGRVTRPVEDGESNRAR
ncbi:hypothetical protein D3105_03435 [Streptomyces globisporus]|uniref:Uncharacterized protein n=2 Tax=Streptomyces TaxID=1883 RepID=A0A423V5J0_STRGL|nr:hypothetical protein D3105_03435 [Streptomyces globisporus]